MSYLILFKKFIFVILLFIHILTPFLMNTLFSIDFYTKNITSLTCQMIHLCDWGKIGPMIDCINDVVFIAKTKTFKTTRWFVSKHMLLETAFLMFSMLSMVPWLKSKCSYLGCITTLNIASGYLWNNISPQIFLNSDKQLIRSCYKHQLWMFFYFC